MKFFIYPGVLACMFSCGRPSSDLLNDQIVTASIIGKEINEITSFKKFQCYDEIANIKMHKNEQGKQFGLRQIQLAPNMHSIILFEELESGQSENEWKIIDYLEINENIITHGQKLKFNSIQKKKHLDEEIFALLPSNTVKHHKVFRAWRADRNRGKIIEIPTVGLTTKNFE